MRSRENSFFVRTLSVLRTRFLRFPLGMLGVFGLLSCLFCAVFSVFFNVALGVSGWGTLSIVATACLPLVSSRRCVATALRESAAARFFFCRVCDCGEDVFGTEEGRGSASPYWLTAWALATGAVVTLMGPARVVLLCVAIAALSFLIAFPEWCPVLIVFVFPFLQLFPHPTLTLAILSLILQVSWWVKAICGRRDISLELTDLPIFLFCLLLLFGGLISRGRAEDGILAALLTATYFPVRRMFTQARCFRRVMRGMQISASVTAAIGILQYFFADLPVRWVDPNRFSDLGGRVTSFFGNPNILAIYLLFCFPHALMGMCERRERTAWRVFFGASVLLQVGCLIVTWSRGAWLGAILQCGTFLLFYSRTSRTIGLLSPIPLAAALPFLPSNILERFTSIGALSESSIRYRLYTWRGVCRMFAAYPHGVGVGESAFAAIYPHYAVSGTETVMHAHNVFLQVGIELGIAGLLIFCVILVHPFLYAVAHSRINGGLLALVGITVMGLFDHLWYERGMLMLLFIGIAMAYVGGRENGIQA